MNLIIEAILFTLINSIWQSGFLLMLYKLHFLFSTNNQPKSNQFKLRTLLFFQLILSVSTFCLYHYNVFFIAIPSSIQNWVYYSHYQIPFANLLFFIYLGAVFIKSFATIYNWYLFKKNTFKNLEKPPFEIRLFARLKSYELSIKKEVAIWYASNIHTPLTVGFLKPIILLPVAMANQLSIEETETLIVHELAHIANNDFVHNLFLVLLEHIYFFNPFLQIMINNIKFEREKICDLQVLNFEYDELTYAKALFKTASNQHLNIQLAAASNKKNELYKRMQFFTAVQKNIELSITQKISFLVTTSIFIGILGSLVFGTQQKDKSLTPNASISTRTITNPLNSNEKAITQYKAEGIVAGKTLSKRVHPIPKKSLHKVAPSEKRENQIIFPVIAVKNIEPITEKQLIVKEENYKTGIIKTSAYKFTFKDQQWNKELMWTIETPLNGKSLSNQEQ